MGGDDLALDDQSIVVELAPNAPQRVDHVDEHQRTGRREHATGVLRDRIEGLPRLSQRRSRVQLVAPVAPFVEQLDEKVHAVR